MLGPRLILHGRRVCTARAPRAGSACWPTSARARGRRHEHGRPVGRGAPRRSRLPRPARRAGPARGRARGPSGRTRLPSDADRRRAARAVLIHVAGTDLADARLVLEERGHRLRSQPGQFSLPGGKRDPGDRDDVHTAPREAQEETGLDPADAHVLGAFAPIPMPWRGAARDPGAELVRRGPAARGAGPGRGRAPGVGAVDRERLPRRRRAAPTRPAERARRRPRLRVARGRLRLGLHGDDPRAGPRRARPRARPGRRPDPRDPARAPALSGGSAVPSCGVARLRRRPVGPCPRRPVVPCGGRRHLAGTRSPPPACSR
ncbi:NUDIX domain-containing protein [Brachybacterium sp. GPGPB12]|uniref:NUDIX domain-containing protein n=1 Tax=Brachybacterium sp. GPGPB12 TaxID=3023517 RepID=UPI00313440B2